MDKKLLASYLDNLRELILDEDKIVTYKYLSRHLGIHVNTAKQLLYTYLSEQKNAKTFPISATYLLAGKLEDGTLKVTIVNEDDKETESSKFVELTSEHIYSVQKGKSLRDIKVLCGIGNDIKESEKLYVIQCPKGVVKPNRKDTSFKCVTDSIESHQYNSSQKSEKTQDSVPVKSSPIKNSLENLGSSESPKETSPIQTKAKADKKKDTVKSSKQKGNIANFFANSSVQKSSQNFHKETTENKPQTNTNKLNVTSPIQNKVNSTPEKNKSTKRKSEGVKRKRIQLFSDSDDSNSDEEPPQEEEEEQVIEDSPEIPVETENNEESERPRNKRKKRKIVDVTVMNDDGYLETRKEVTLATDSEEETEKVNTKSTKTPANNLQEKSPKMESKRRDDQQTSSGPKKQSSLLTFFKKN